MSLGRRRLAPLALGLVAAPAAARAAVASRAEIDAAVAPALASLQADNFTAVLLKTARAVILFPRVVRGGFVFGGQFGQGAMLEAGETTGYYSISGASFGLLIGAERFGLGMFIMTASALEFFRKTHGWEIGIGPTVVPLDQGLAGTLTTTTFTQDVYAVSFNQQGLLAALTLDGTRISRIAVE